jgi:hypothetical protein
MPSASHVRATITPLVPYLLETTMRRLPYTVLALTLAPTLAAQQGYLVDSNLDQLFTVDLATGAATLVASTLNNTLATPADLTFDDAGVL